MDLHFPDLRKFGASDGADLSLRWENEPLCFPGWIADGFHGLPDIHLRTREFVVEPYDPSKWTEAAIESLA